MPPWLFTRPFNPKKIAPLYFLGSSFDLNFLRGKYENNKDILVKDFFKLSVINLAVPSAVLSAILPVKPSVTITLTLHSL